MQVSAAEGQHSTCLIISPVAAAVRSIHGRRRGSNTRGNPRQQFPEWQQRSGRQVTVTSPLVYCFAVFIGLLFFND
jgi:hypothetical protein